MSISSPITGMLPRNVTKRPYSLYRTIVEAAFGKNIILEDERRTLYRALSYLEEKGVDLSPALCAEQEKNGKDIITIREEFNNAVVSAFGTSFEKIFEARDRTQEMSYKRRACYAVLLMRYHITSGGIAEYFDTHRDRTTIVYNLKKHLDDYKYNQKYNAYYRALLDASAK